MPLVRGLAPISSATSTPSKARDGIVVDLGAGQQRERAVVEFHHHALGGADRVGQLEQSQLHRGVVAEHRARRDAEERGIADLAGGAGDGDGDRGAQA